MALWSALRLHLANLGLGRFKIRSSGHLSCRGAFQSGWNRYCHGFSTFCDTEGLRLERRGYPVLV